MAPGDPAGWDGENTEVIYMDQQVKDGGCVLSMDAWGPDVPEFLNATSHPHIRALDQILRN